MLNLDIIDIHSALEDRLGEEPARALLKYIRGLSRATAATEESLSFARDESKDEHALLHHDLMKL